MASKGSPLSLVSHTQRNFLTTEEALAAVLNSKDGIDEIDSSSSDDSSKLNEHTVDDTERDDKLQNVCDEIEPCFKESRLICDVSSSMSVIESLHSCTGYCQVVFSYIFIDLGFCTITNF